jgi:peroxiredoxin
MALTPSTMLPLGTAAPDFSLKDTVSGKTMTLATFAGKKALLVMFICNHCPYVKHLKSALAQLGKDYAGKDVAIVGISANDPVSHPEDAPEKLAADAKASGYVFPVLFDETQKVAQAYQAACTPDFYVFDAGRKLAYRGQFDDSRPGNGKPVTGSDLRAALEAVLGGKAAASKQAPSLGCNIKWRAGCEPAYFLKS